MGLWLQSAFPHCSLSCKGPAPVQPTWLSLHLAVTLLNTKNGPNWQKKKSTNTCLNTNMLRDQREYITCHNCHLKCEDLNESNFDVLKAILKFSSFVLKKTLDVPWVQFWANLDLRIGMTPAAKNTLVSLCSQQFKQKPINNDNYFYG